MSKKLTIKEIQRFKHQKKISMITAYDALFGKLFDGLVDMILVGDSLNMSFGGNDDTLSLSIDEVIYHTRAVCRGAKESFIIADMPFGSYATKEMALDNAIKIFKQTHASAVKLEGGADRYDIISHLCQNDIALMGHIGLLPQGVRAKGGYFIKGKNDDEEQRLLQDAKALEEAGVFAIIGEGIKGDVAKRIADSLEIPFIGIGCGKDIDGQVLVWSDMLGFFEAFKPKFVREYLSGADLVKEAVKAYVKDVETMNFPSEKETY